MAVSEGVTLLSLLSEISRGSSGFITRGIRISTAMKFKTESLATTSFLRNKRSLYQLKSLSEEEKGPNHLF